MGAGRPIKSTNKRIQVCIYVDLNLLSEVDQKVRRIRELGDSGISRSEVYHRALKKWLKEN